MADSWEGEDQEEADLDNWEDEFSEKPKEAPKPKPQPKKLTKKQRQRQEEARRKKEKEEREAFEQDKEAQRRKKEEEKKAVEEADHALTEELFEGVGESDDDAGDAQAEEEEPARVDYDDVDAYDMMGGDLDSDDEQPAAATSGSKAAAAPPAGSLPPPDVTTSIKALSLSADKEYKQLAHEIATCLKSSDKRKQIVFLKELTGSLTDAWSFEEFNSYVQSVTVISNAKKKTTGKKKKKGGATLKVDKGGSSKAYDDYQYDDFGDFM